MSDAFPHEFVLLLGIVLTLTTLPGTVELLFLTIGACLPKTRRPTPPAANAYRLFAVIPAHDEEIHIERCLRSIARAERSGLTLQVVVVADNCSDQTAALARKMGVYVLERVNDRQRGKGYALDFAFRRLLPEDPDAFVVIDADSEVAVNFFVETARLFRSGADAVQARYFVCSPDTSAPSRLIRLASFAFNVLRPLGREGWGLSAGIYGNGFAMSAQTIREVPYSATSIVEDLEYHLALVAKHKRVVFARATAVYASIPASAAGLKTQRARWEGGRFRMLAAHLFPLLWRIARGNFASAELLLDLLLPPLAWYVALLLATLLVPLPVARVSALIGLAALVFHLAIAFLLSDSDSRDLAALGTAFLYVLRKVSTLPRALKSANSGATWVRTDRLGERRLK